MKSVASTPSNFASHSSRAVEQATDALRAGNQRHAEWILRSRLAEAPGDALALATLGELLRDDGRAREAIVLLRSALRFAPDFDSARLVLARLHQGQGEPQLALEQYQALPDAIRSSFDVAVHEAMLLGLLGRHEPEIAIYQRLARERPREPSLWMSLGNALKYAGRTGEAVRALRQAVKVRPSYGEGWWSLANVKTVRFSRQEIETMRKALSGAIAPVDALHLHFALGKALEDRGDYQQSFAHYDQGNAIRSSALTPQQTSVAPFVDKAIATYDAPLFERLGKGGDPARDPIFVVGLQRSGSTLVEQILASHPMIEGTAELVVIQQLWSELAREAEAAGRSAWDHVRDLNPARLKAIGADYLDRCRPFRSTGRPMFIDKLPANWMNVGFIRLILPHARIVDSRRHPMACGFSNFKQHYATGVSFAYSQQSIAGFYRDYLRLMRHFDAVLPGHVHHILNEKLIEDPEAETRRLIEFIGVPFDEACLAPHRNERAVRTPSAEQVRRPINRDGVDYWRKFEPWLEPMKQALGPALNEWDRAG